MPVAEILIFDDHFEEKREKKKLLASVLGTCNTPEKTKADISKIF